VFNKLCDIIKHPSIFSEISYEEVDGKHLVEGVLNDKFFSVSSNNEKSAKDDFALAVFKAYQQDKPIKTKTMENKCVGQMLCWSAEHSATRFNRNISFRYAGQDGNKVKVAAFEKTFVKNEETGKRQAQESELLSVSAANIHDAKFEAGIAVLNREETREKYVNWVKNGKRAAQPSSTADFVKQEDGIEGEYAKQLREFCEKYGIPAPEYYLAPEGHEGSVKALCKILIHAKNQSKEAACSSVNDVLVKICTDQDAVRAAQREADQAQLKEARAAAKAAKVEEQAARKERLNEANEQRKAAIAKRKAEKAAASSDGASPPKKPKKEPVPVAPMAIYTREMLQVGFGDQLDQNPISTLANEVKNNTGSSVQFFDCPAPGGFNCTASVDGVTAIGYSTKKKLAKQVAAQALLMTLRTAATQAAQAAAPPAKKAAGPPQPLNAVAIITQCAQFFKQEVAFECDDGNLTPDGVMYTTVVTFGDKTATGSGKNKKESKKNAAELLLPAVESQYGSFEDAKAVAAAAKKEKSRAALAALKAKSKEAKAAAKAETE